MTSALRGADILSIGQFSRADLELLFDETDRIAKLGRREKGELLAGRVLVSAFFQSSTRTRLSFESAMLRGGGRALGFADPKTTRAGDYEQESLADTIMMCSYYGDVIVLRHPETGSAASAARTAEIPVINAGDGWGEHPTQTLADLYTMRQRFGQIDGLSIGLVGDFRVRCMHSMISALALFDCDVVCVSPPDRQFEADYRHRYEAAGRRLAVASTVDEILPEIDALYLGSAIQQPNFSAGHDAAAAKLPTPDAYCVNLAKLSRGKPHLAVLDALARGDELATDVDGSAFNAYWAEAANAVLVRLALLTLILDA